MEKFEDYFDASLKDEYTHCCEVIRANILDAYYDLYVLEQIEPYAKRNKLYQRDSYVFLKRLVYVFWQDLVLLINKLAFDGKKDEISLIKLKNLLIPVQKDKPTGISTKLNFNNIKDFNAFRNEEIAHCLNIDSNLKLYLNTAESGLNYITQCFHDRLFQVNNKNYEISSDYLKKLKKCIKIGIDDSIKPSGF